MTFLSLLLFILIYLVRTNKIYVLDETISYKIIETRTNIKSKIMIFLTTIGKSKFVTLIYILLFIFFKKEETFPIISLIGTLISIPANASVKRIMKRQRPNLKNLVKETDHSFPSAHACTATTLYGSILVYFFNVTTFSGILTTILCIMLILLISYSRIYLGVHYFSDVLGGWILGALILAIVRSLISFV